MDIQVLNIKGEKYALLPPDDLNKLMKDTTFEEKAWYSLDEICDEFGVGDADIEFTVAQVADILGKKQNEIRELIRIDVLKASKIRGRYFIKKTEVDELKKGHGN